MLLRIERLLVYNWRPRVSTVPKVAIEQLRNQIFMGKRQKGTWKRKNICAATKDRLHEVSHY